MTTPLIPQEIYLLERFCSLERYGQMRDAWEAMLNHAESMLDRFMHNLPPRYRKRPLPEQPDIVWGERVLPNFRYTMRLLNDGYIKRSHGDYEALGRACGVTGGIRGQRDFWSGWMDEVEPGAEAKYYELLYKAGDLAWPVDLTSGGIWSPGALTTRYDKVVKEPLNPPPAWPTYRLNWKVTVKSGDRVPQTGIYLPDVDHGFPTLLIKSDDPLLGEANEASVVLDPSVSSKKGYRPTTWTLVERIADERDLLAQPSLIAPIRLRAEGGQPCPQTGYWYTPAKLNSRRHFKEGEVMPVFQSDYGSTIWQWDSNQA
ncbi:hypothetical protein [Herbaspirillum sp. ST 5-3]|uniref:hypothetical protein n=1 Tax=Oxalobacteraceae TaxID=75682 RepID=UPI0010A2E108|nr:hypothetical protein [Herbaspirillum sp. ST 5-3]